MDFVIAGAQKAASTTLYELLRQHPDIAMPATKEVQFFTQGDCFRMGAAYLDTYRRGARVGALFGLADVQIMYVPEAAARCAAVNPAMRILVVLRNPVDRAYSAYWFARSRGFEDAHTFEEALDREAAREAGDYHTRGALTYVAHGRYAEQLERLGAAVGRDNVLVFRYEDLVADPATCAKRAFAWLGVAVDATIATRVHANPTGQPRLRMLQRLIVASSLRRLASRVLGTGVKYWARRHVLVPLLDRNLKREPYPVMRSDTRQRLVAYFRPWNARLREQLGADLSSWDR